METKRPIATRRKKIFSGRALCGFGALSSGDLGAGAAGDGELGAGVCGLFGRAFHLCGSLWWRGLSDRDDRRLFLVNLCEQHGPGGRLVAAAAGGFVQAEGLERSGKGEEEQRGSNEDAKIEMGQA